MESLKKFVDSYTEGGNEFIKRSIVFVILMLLIRFLEIIWLSNLQLNSGYIGFQLYGLLYDLLFSFQLLGFLFLPYMGIYLLSRKFANPVFITFTSLVILLYTALITYYTQTNTLLGSGFFTGNLSDFQSWSLFADSSVYLILVGVLICIWLLTAVYKRINRIKFTSTFQSVYLIVLLLSLFFTGFKIDGSKFDDKHSFNLTENKLHYFIYSSIHYHQNEIKIKELKDSNMNIENELLTIIEHKNSNRDYPFWHKDQTPDVLGAFLNVNDTIKPNIVFIIVEGLGTAYSGSSSYMGSFTPFLDSLASKSLYWTNFIGSATNNSQVLPAILASVPFVENGFGNLKDNMPKHLSLPRLLKKNNYTTSFFYGGNANNENMKAFLSRQKLNFIIDEKSFGKDYKKTTADLNGFSTGYTDNELFRKYINFSSKRVGPGFDVLLTQSMHAPFAIDQYDVFANKVEKRIVDLKLSKDQGDIVRHYKEQFSAILYCDESLKNLFQALSKLPSYKNTIFMLTGSSRISEIPMLSEIDRFHVPLIIYSPLLITSKTVNAVSGHIDITPTFISLMRNSYHLKLPEYCHWLGFELETSSSFSSLHAYGLSNKSKLEDMVIGANYLSNNNSYVLKPNLELEQRNDFDMRVKLIEKMSGFKLKNKIVTRTNKLLPDSIYSKW